MIDLGGDNVVVHLDDGEHRLMVMVDPAKGDLVHVNFREYRLAMTDVGDAIVVLVNYAEHRLIMFHFGYDVIVHVAYE